MSFGSELSNRAPTFDMDLSDLMHEEQPISYEKAYKYFAEDPSQKWVTFTLNLSSSFFGLSFHYYVFWFRWAAYVAGTILVLMTELGVRFTDSICILVWIFAFPFLYLFIIFMQVS